MSHKRFIKIKEFLFTGFYSGYFPVAPGTAGTVVGLAIYVLEMVIFGPLVIFINIGITILSLYPSLKLCGAGEIFFGEKDPSQVVIDEMVGYWFAVMFHPFSWKVVIIAFIIFRIIDILKPYPISKLQNMGGGLGVLIDDIVAGISTNLIIVALLFFDII